MTRGGAAGRRNLWSLVVGFLHWRSRYYLFVSQFPQLTISEKILLMGGFYYFQKSGQIGAGFLLFSKNLAKNGGVFISSLDFFQILGFFSIKWSQKFSRASRAWGVFIILKIFPRFARGFYFFQKILAKSSRVLIFSLIRGGFLFPTAR